MKKLTPEQKGRILDTIALSVAIILIIIVAEVIFSSLEINGQQIIPAPSDIWVYYLKIWDDSWIAGMGLTAFIGLAISYYLFGER